MGNDLGYRKGRVRVGLVVIVVNFVYGGVRVLVVNRRSWDFDALRLQEVARLRRRVIVVVTAGRFEGTTTTE